MRLFHRLIKTNLVLLLLAALLMQGCGSAPQEEPTPTVTEVPMPVIDGTLSPGEWEDARVEYFFEGSELLWMQSEDYWYIGIRADTPEMIVVNIFIKRGDTINILHASAALGTAAYQKEGDSWMLTQEFTWSCRDTSESAEALAERAAFLEAEGWVSTNTYIGNLNESEFQIERQEDSLRVAVTFMIVPGNSPTFWPTSLTDASSRDLDSLPGRIDFSPEEWGVIPPTE
jgi:hypothetical protein